MDEYKITIKSTLENEVNELVTFGSLSNEEGDRTIGYYDDERGTETRIVIGKNGIVSIVREGERNSVFTFEKGHAYEASVDTEFGNIMFCIRTSDIRLEENPDGLKLFLDYTSDLGGEENRFGIIVDAERINYRS